MASCQQKYLHRQGISRLQSAAAETTGADGSSPVGAACSRDGRCRKYRGYKPLPQPFTMGWCKDDRGCNALLQKLAVPMALPRWQRLAAAMAGAGNIAVTNRSHSLSRWAGVRRIAVAIRCCKNLRCRWPYPGGSGLLPRWQVQGISRLQTAPTAGCEGMVQRVIACRAVSKKTPRQAVMPDGALFVLCDIRLHGPPA